MEFYKRLAPAKRECVLKKPGWYIWGATVCKYRDRYYMFAAGWEKKYGFKGWVQHSTIFKCISEKPEGPFEILGELEELKHQRWGGTVLHNPTICQVGELYYLFYVGTKYEINEQNRDLPDDYEVCRYNQRIGLAVSKNPAGTFRPVSEVPVLDICKNAWDDTYVTNPSVWAESGKIYMVYKALLKERLPEIVMKLGLVAAEQIEGPYRRMQEHPLLPYNVEDPFLWKEDGHYYMLTKDMTGELTGSPDAAIVLESDDLVNFTFEEKKAAYSTSIEWEDGIEQYINVERPQIYFEDGKPVCLYNAVRTTQDESFNVARRFR